MSQDLEQAFIQSIQAHEGIIHKVIRLYVDEEEDRQDLRQEILLQAWRSYQRFKGNAAFSTWLYRVALNTVLTFRRKAATRQKHVSTQPPPEYADTRKQLGDDLSEALYLLIKQMGDVDKMLISLHLEGYKNPEIADIMGLTTNHVNVKIHRLKKRLISQLKTFA